MNALKISIFVLIMAGTSTYGELIISGPPRQIGILHCVPNLSLKDVFDGGFRPYRVTEDTCRIGKSTFTITLPAAKNRLTLDVKSASFDISKYDTITRLDIRCMTSSVESAGTLLREITRALGLEPLSLNDALKRTTPSDPHWPEGWTLQWENEWAKGQLSLDPQNCFIDDPSRGYREMKADVLVFVKWKQTEKGFIFRTKPIMPPKGYEDVSMDIPNSDLVKAAQLSDSSALAHLRYPDEAQRKAILDAKPIPIPKIEQPNKLELKKPIIASHDKPESPSMLVWLLVVIAATVGAVWVFLRKAK